jgi:ketosteroid isomerase-like protein
MKLARLLCVLCLAQLAFAQSPEDQIRAKTQKFTQAIVSKDLTVLDDVFEKDPNDIYYDINEGPLTGFERLRRVWTAATTNNSITRFNFNDDMKIIVDGKSAVQTATWTQTQENRAGQSRDIRGRVTVLWREREGQWRVWHYHASVTPPRAPRMPQ